MSSGLDLLLPLLGRWTGRALVDFPGQPAPIRLRHTEAVTQHALGTVISLEGTSYRDDVPDGDPVFGAIAVAGLDGDQVRWTAYQGGHALDRVFDLSPGRYAWTAPTGSDQTVDYRADFDAEHWTEVGTLIIGGVPREVFRMTLQRD